jgi:predicted kinase
MADRAKPLLVVVTGPPASGKTTVARRIAHGVGLPLFAKDDFKEILFDVVGTGDREWSRRLGDAVFRILFHLMNEELRAGGSIVVEANFAPGLTEPQVAELPPHRFVQLYCTAPEDVLVERFRSRARHPGHLDEAIVEDVRRGIREGRWAPLEVSGELVEVDVGHADWDALVERVRG